MPSSRAKPSAQPSAPAAQPFHPTQNWLLHGPAGHEKTTAAATWPKPMRVFMFDQPGKETPYLRHGLVSRVGPNTLQVVGRKTKKLLIQLDLLRGDNPTAPRAWRRFLELQLELEQQPGMWRTVVVDSATFAELAARMYDKYKVNPTARDPRQWWAASTDGIEQEIILRLVGNPDFNTVVICHTRLVEDDVEGRKLKLPDLPGRLPAGAPSGFSEVYYCDVSYAKADSPGAVRKPVYLFRTQASPYYRAMSIINAPDPCEMRYDALWDNWQDIEILDTSASAS